MKTFTAALLAAALVSPALVAAPAMAQQHDRADRGDHRASAAASRQTYKTFRKGQKFDRRYARNYQIVDHRRYRGVKAPPRGYHYVRSGNDLLLVNIGNGMISSIRAGQFR